jgi:two-component system response regulator DevR
MVSNIAGLSVAGIAATPASALDLMSQLFPPIMILDMYLSAGTGIDLLRELSSRQCNTRAVVVTGAPSKELRNACLRLGARYCYDKGLEIDQIQAALKCLAAEASDPGHIDITGWPHG